MRAVCPADVTENGHGGETGRCIISRAGDDARSLAASATGAAARRLRRQTFCRHRRARKHQLFRPRRRGSDARGRERCGQVDTEKHSQRPDRAGCRTSAYGRHRLERTVDHRCRPFWYRHDPSGTQPIRKPHRCREHPFAASAAGGSAGSTDGAWQHRRARSCTTGSARISIPPPCRGSVAGRTPNGRDCKGDPPLLFAADPRRTDNLPEPAGARAAVRGSAAPAGAKLCHHLHHPLSGGSVRAGRPHRRAARRTSGRNRTRKTKFRRIG